MLRLDTPGDYDLSEAVLGRLPAIVHACFTHRRKTMRWSLRTVLDEPTLAAVETDARWDLSLRPEQITVDQWIQLAQRLV